MKKRLFAWLMVLVMLVSALPLTAFAAGGGGGVNPPSDSYYNPDNAFGYDSMTQGGTLAGITVSVNGKTLTRNSATSTTGEAFNYGITITFEPGYYLYAYKVVCGDKYSCQTAASNQAISESNVMSGATQSSITLKLEKKAFGHSSERAPYWILLDVKKDTTKYVVSYDWGELTGEIEAAVPDSEEHLVNDVVTVKAPSQAALDEAKALGYTFIGWKSNVSGTTYQPNGKFGMPQQNVTLVAQWEKIPTVDVTVTKVWNDNNNANNNRPASITVTLLKNGEAAGSVTLPQDGKWEYTWTGLSTGFTYTVEEAAVTGYNSAVTGDVEKGFVITNTEATTSVQVKKDWVDNENQDGKRPGSVTVKLLADEVDTGKTVTLSKDNNWTASFTGLNAYADQKAVNYTVEEVAVDGYKPSYTWNADHTEVTISNRHEPEKASITITKEWDDGDDQDNLRPDSITVTLYKDEGDGIAKVGDFTLTAEDGWTLTINSLPKYENGKEIVYSVDEAEVPEGYTKSIKDFTITNTHAPETVEVSGEKIWVDDNDAAKARPDSITIILMADGVRKASKTVTAADEWKWTFENLPKNSNGKEIQYTISEETVTDYTSSVTGNAADGFTVTNTYNPGKTYLTVNKEWVDNKDQDGKRPDSVTIQLFANGKKLGDPVELSAKNQWTYTFTDLDKTSGGKQIVYTVEEEAVAGYKTTYAAKDNVIIVTNTHDPEIKDLTVTKLWYDNKDKGNLRPDSIEIQLYKNGKAYGDKVKLTAKGDWKYTFEDMPVYENGKKIEWTVKEVKVPQYYNVSYKQDTLTIMNTIQSDGSAKTGDSFNIWLWVSLMGVSAACVVTFFILNKKRKNA